MKIIMSGGGDSEHFAALDKLFLSHLSDNPSVLFIPLAGEPSDFNNGLERIQGVFSSIHFDNIEMCLDLEELSWQYLKKFDAIYIDGGNTFVLMEEIRNTHFYELLRRFLHHGGIINGDSAGAIILGSHLQTAHFGEIPDENLPDVISYQGLNLFGHWAIHCHYQDSDDHEILNFVHEYGFPVLALYEESGLAFFNNTIEVIGERPVKFFDLNSQRTLFPGESRLFNSGPSFKN